MSQENKRQPTQKEKILTITMVITFAAFVTMVILELTGVVKDSFGIIDMIIGIGWAQIALMNWKKGGILDKFQLVLAILHFTDGLVECFKG